MKKKFLDAIELELVKNRMKQESKKDFVKKRIKLQEISLVTKYTQMFG